MKKLISFIIIILLIVGAAFVVIYPQTRLPQYVGRIPLSNLKGEVQVTRDRWGIPHIEAQNNEDLYRGLGFVMAGDRLFQMDLIRRIANGQLSEVLGEKTIEFDVLLRKLRIRAHMNDVWERKFHKLDPKMVKLMEAFFDGVHQYIETQPLPIEFKILGYKPRPFSPQEAMAASGYLALSFAEALLSDPLHSDLMDELPKEVLDQMWIREGADKNKVTEQKRVSYRLENQVWYKDLISAIDYFQDVLGLFHGSNSWILAGSRSKSGKPLLANDPHVAFSNPAVWYEAHLKSPDFESYGHYIPLVPFPAMAHNSQRGWAVTMSEIDDLDLYEEKINEKDEVLYRGKWVPLNKERQTIKVKGGKDLVIDVVTTPHGPLLDNTKYGLKEKHLAIKWSYHHPENDVATAFYLMSQSTKLEDLDHALSYGASPGLNISWVDAKGNIAWRVMGKIPIRRGFKGNQILEGWSGKHEYERYFTIKENPGLINPENGVIVTANYHPLYKGNLPIEGYWQPSERYERIHQLISHQEKWSSDGMKRIQNDQFVVTGQAMVKELLDELKVETEEDKAVVNILRKWQGKSDRESVAASIYHMWTHHLGKMAIKDELGEQRYIAYNKVADFWNFFKSFLYDRNSPLWDDKRTKKKESRSDLINLSFKKAISRLKEKFGPKIENWKWGELHQLEVEHPLGKVKPLNMIFNTGPMPAGGGYFQVDNMSSPRYNDSFQVKLGPSVRRVVDMAKPRNSFGILPTGNVGHFNSPFYDDQFEMFLNGEHRDQWMNLEDVKKHPHQILNLYPLGTK